MIASHGACVGGDISLGIRDLGLGCNTKQEASIIVWVLTTSFAVLLAKQCEVSKKVCLISDLLSANIVT